MMADLGNLQQALGGSEKKKSSVRPATIILAILLIISLSIAYLGVTVLTNLNSIRQSRKGPLPRPTVSAALEEQDILYYNNVAQYLPYALIRYSSFNTTYINANATLLRYPPPSKIYLVNISNECFQCGNTTAIESAFFSKLMKYGIIQSPANVSIVYPDSLLDLPNDSLIIVLNGLLPSTFFSTVSGNLTVLDYLLIRHTSIIYVGQAFNNMLLPDSVITPASAHPTYLQTVPYSGNSLVKNRGYFFNKSTFAFANYSEFGGSQYFRTIYSGYISYNDVYNGTIIAFPNTASAWQTPNQTGSDLAKAVQQMFWLPRYGAGTRTIKTPNTANATGELGVVMNATTLLYNASIASEADKTGALRIVLAENAVYSYGAANSIYQYIVAKPQLYDNGTLGIYKSIVTNQTVPLTFSIATHSNTLVNIQPHLTIYTINMTEISSTPLSFIHNISNNFTFLLPYQRIQLQPGLGYIIKLHSFYGTEYAGAFFNVSPLVLFLVSANATSDRFYFSITSNKQPINNLAYTLKLNNQYPQKGVIRNGTIFYQTPKGTPTIVGKLNFSLNVSGSIFYYGAAYNPLPFAINEQYIEVLVVVILMLVMVIFVKAPGRDEFYIDLPNLPEQKKASIKLKPKEIMDVFDRLNASYHWKYMPLSKGEVRSAIASYIRYSNIPVSITYNNLENILAELAVNKYLVSIDELYAPVQWIDASKHDIEYLATYKKLRLFLVTHGFIFTDMDTSTNADIVATLRNERKYIVIYSKSSKFQKIPVYNGSVTYIAFINSFKIEDFRNSLYSSTTAESEQLKMYISANYVKLIDANNPEELIS